MARAIPSLRERFRSNRDYAQRGVEEIFGPALNQAQMRQATVLESMVFLNRGKRFIGRPLPTEAQFSPAFGLSVGDFDGDGHDDILMAQNFFDTAAEISEYDAGRGLLLRGDGTGQFRAVPSQESGIAVYGEQRGSGVADYDHDGRLDWVVCQNAGPTRLYHNRNARPGLRVRLLGPPGNPDGIGAVVRLEFGSAFGPAREVHSGSGYWSQDAAVQVLALPQVPTGVEVRWPGGKRTRAALKSGAREISMSAAGELKVNQ